MPNGHKRSRTELAPRTNGLFMGVVAMGVSAGVGLLTKSLIFAVTAFGVIGLALVRLFPRAFARLEGAAVAVTNAALPPAMAALPAIGPPDARMEGMASTDGRWVWGFAISFTITPADGDTFLLDGSKCSAFIKLDKDTKEFEIPLLNIQKNDGPAMTTARIDDAAAIMLLNRLEIPWLPDSQPARVLGRAVMVDSKERKIEVPFVLLIKPDMAIPTWTATGLATNAEIAEFIT